MTPQTQEKINRIKHLFSEMDRIEKEVEVILDGNALGDALDEKSVEKRHYRKKTETEKGVGKGKGTPHCKKCGKAGHRSNHCTEGEPELADELNSEPVELDRYQNIKTAFEHDLPIKEIASEYHMMRREVNKILQSHSYETYLKMK